MLRLPTLTVALVLTLAPFIRASAASARDGIAERCLGYAVHLRSARNELERGNRRAALAELRQAQAALDQCVRAEPDEPIALAAGPPPQQPRVPS